MNNQDTFRQIYYVHGGRGPRKIVMDVYEDGYTPLDVVSALTCFILENPVLMEAFRQYVDEDQGDFTGAEAHAHLRVVLKLFVTLWNTPESTTVYVTGNQGWVN